MKKQKNAQLVLPREEWPYEVPENWVWTRHNIIADISGGSQPDKSYFVSEPQEGYTQLYQTRDYGEHPVPVYIPNKYATKTTNEGDILLARYGGSLGKVFKAHQGAYNVALAKVINLIPKILNDEFLYQYYQSHFYQNFCMQAANGRSAQSGFNRTDMENLLFPLPPLPEQQRIVARIESLFAKIDTAAEKIRATLDQFPIRKAAILHKAFTGELTKKWRKENGVGMESWEETTLKDETLQIGDGLHGTPNFDKLGKYYFVNGNNLNDDCIQIKNDTKRINEIEYEKYKVELSSNTVLLSINGTLGKTAFYRKEPIILGKSACYINVSKKLNKNFLRYYFNTWFFRDYANEKATGSTIKNLGLKAIREMPLYLPTFSEQKEIVRILDAIFEREQAAKETAERLLEQIALTKKSILARAFRGLLGTNDPKEESAEGWLEEKNSQSET